MVVCCEDLQETTAVRQRLLPSAHCSLTHYTVFQIVYIIPLHIKPMHI